MPHDEQDDEPLAVSVNQALRLLPIGRTTLYREIDSGTIESKLVNGRRWLIYESLKRYAGVK
jgi:excisionase family DNA binding protein